MMKYRRIYLLSPKDLSPETIAVTFAKTSRSPKPFDEIADELTDEKSARFHEKWVVGYGHASVAEHAVLHLALENVSRLAIETIEGNRLASYTEKSTRYQQWNPDAFYIPGELEGHDLEATYVETCQDLFQTYQQSIPKVQSWLQGVSSQKPEESSKAYDRRIHTAAVDVCRFLLPAASLANVGVTINARALEYAICKMLSSPLQEVRSIGERLREVGQHEAPTLIKYAACNNYLITTREKMAQAADKIKENQAIDSFRLIFWDEEGEDKILAALLFRFSRNIDFQSCYDFVRGLNENQKEDFVNSVMSDRGKFDQPLREFEHALMTFELVMDQGAYFEFKRHRMMTQTAQPLTADLGFALPKAITESGCEGDYLRAMRRAADLYHRASQWNPDVASYLIPNGFNRRVLFTMNLREAFHFCHLRAADNAHFSIRWVAQHVFDAIKGIYPYLGSFIDVPASETWQGIQDQYFTSMKIK